MNTFTTHPDRLTAKVAALNRVNRLALEMMPRMIAALQPFLGKKIINADGMLSKAAREALPKDNAFGIGASADRWWYRSHSSSVSVNFEVQECAKEHGKPGEFWPRMGCGLNLARCNDGVLTELIPAPVLRTDHTAEEVRQLRKELAELEQRQNDIESELGQFGKHDWNC